MALATSGEYVTSIPHCMSLVNMKKDVSINWLLQFTIIFTISNPSPTVGFHCILVTFKTLISVTVWLPNCNQKSNSWLKETQWRKTTTDMGSEPLKRNYSQQMSAFTWRGTGSHWLELTCQDSYATFWGMRHDDGCFLHAFYIHANRLYYKSEHRWLLKI